MQRIQPQKLSRAEAAEIAENGICILCVLCDLCAMPLLEFFAAYPLTNWPGAPNSAA